MRRLFRVRVKVQVVRSRSRGCACACALVRAHIARDPSRITLSTYVQLIYRLFTIYAPDDPCLQSTLQRALSQALGRAVVCCVISFLLTDWPVKHLRNALCKCRWFLSKCNLEEPVLANVISQPVDAVSQNRKKKKKKNRCYHTYPSGRIMTTFFPGV